MPLKTKIQDSQGSIVPKPASSIRACAYKFFSALSKKASMNCDPDGKPKAPDFTLSSSKQWSNKRSRIPSKPRIQAFSFQLCPNGEFKDLAGSPDPARIEIAQCAFEKLGKELPVTDFLFPMDRGLIL
jgi:hypothetical protein